MGEADTPAGGSVCIRCNLSLVKVLDPVIERAAMPVRRVFHMIAKDSLGIATYFEVPHETAASWRRHGAGKTMWIFDEVEGFPVREGRQALYGFWRLCARWRWRVNWKVQ